MRPSYHHKSQLKQGFTLVEMLVVAPIVILMIGVFIGAIISMTGDVLSSRGSSSLAYSIQDALSRIQQDVAISESYLATNGVTLKSPQGYDDGIEAFKNIGTNGQMLIIKTQTTTSNPLGATRNLVYLKDSPNACTDTKVAANTKLFFNTIYFVKDNALWRRVVAPDGYTATGCSIPWQRPSCATLSDTFCKSLDTKIVSGIDEFNISYYSGTDPSTSLGAAVTGDDTSRQSALDGAKTIEVNITATSNTAGRNVTQTGKARISMQSISARRKGYLSDSNGGTWSYKRLITINNPSGGPLTDYQLLVNPFTDSTFINNSGLIGSWHMNEGAGTTAVDLSGSDNTGTMNGSSYWTNDGKFGKGFIGDGSANYISTSIQYSNPLTFTIAAWFKADLASLGKKIIGFESDKTGTASANSSRQIYIGTEGKAYFGVCGEENCVDKVISSDGNIADNKWHYAVGTYASGVATFYIDGKKQGEPLGLTAPVMDGFWRIGSYKNGTRPYGGSDGYFTGLIDEVSIFNRALTADEIANRYGSLGTPKVRSDYGDVRFTKEGGTEELPYWKESEDKYWVKYSGNLDVGYPKIEMYYGNKAAGFPTDCSLETSLANCGQKTFAMYDDFSTTIDVGRWNVSGVPTPTSGVVRLTNNQSIASKTLFGTGHVLTAKAALFLPSSTAGSNYASMEFNQNPGKVYIDSNRTENNYQASSTDGTDSQDINITTNESFYHYEIQKIDGSSAKFYRNNILLASKNQYLNGGLGSVKFIGTGTGWVDVDWVFIRKLASTGEPTVAAIEEEKRP